MLFHRATGTEYWYALHALELSQKCILKFQTDFETPERSSDVPYEDKRLPCQCQICIERQKKLPYNELSYITILLKKKKRLKQNDHEEALESLFLFSMSYILLFCLKFFMQQYRLDYNRVDYDFLFEGIFMFIMQRSLCASDCLQWLGI